MAKKSMLKTIITASILTTLLCGNLFVVEAAPSKNSGKYPYPPQQQQSRQNAPRPVMQQPRRNPPRPVMQQPKQNASRPVMQQPRQNAPRPVMQQPRQNSPRPVMQQPRQNAPRPVMQQPRQNAPRPVMQQPRQNAPRPVMQRPRQNASRPVKQQPKQNAPRPVMQQPKHRPVQHQVTSRWEPRHTDIKHEGPKVHAVKHTAVKADTNRPKHMEPGKLGPRHEMVRRLPVQGHEMVRHPPVPRPHENRQAWHRPPKPPKNHWWDHRPSHGWGPYRGYYNGIYYSDVASALLAAEIIHSACETNHVTVINYADSSDRIFIPKEAVKYKGHHYLVFSDIGNSMEEAQQFCESMGGHLATVEDDGKNERLFRLINDSGYVNEQFEKFGYNRLIPKEPITYEKVIPENGSEEDAEYYGLYYWNYRNLRDNGMSAGTGGTAFVCEWDV